ncbi:hypothetical protein EJ04DRAFT_594771 [Polyplosphaeria fusca]|uniref:Fungal N-terminal domain-containing protein n=1 Tax=Polyplosphaeria fusca TaxID=682080 RepID=A0A9P4UWT7_9PLEO|nr:hypothetical protein EJ04DRAFT_594771 [Polyplosphaeria fusca]
MEPIAILGVAGNVIQLIDFAGKLVSKTHSYRRSGSLVEHQDLQIVSNDLAHLSSKLIDDLRDDASSLSENDRALRTISESVIRISKDIEATLTAAALPGSRGRWKSFRHALKAAWGAEKLSDMKARLDLYSQQLQNRMHVKMHESVAELRNDVLESLEKVTDIAVQGKDSSREDLVRLREEAETNINQLKEELRALKVDLEKCIRDAVASAAQASKVEQRGLQEATNARFNLWAAKETILKQLQVRLLFNCFQPHSLTMCAGVSSLVVSSI